MKCNSVYITNKTKGGNACHGFTRRKKKKSENSLLGMVPSSEYTNLPLKEREEAETSGKVTNEKVSQQCNLNMRLLVFLPVSPFIPRVV